MGYFDLADYYKMLFSLQVFWNWPMPMVEEWTPATRELNILMLAEHIEKEEAKRAKK
jgi:hypothetical protein